MVEVFGVSMYSVSDVCRVCFSRNKTLLILLSEGYITAIFCLFIVKKIAVM